MQQPRRPSSSLVSAAPAVAAERPIGDGAWSWFGDPRAVTHDGRTYVGWVDHEGDVKVSSYDHATGERVTAVLQARLNQDDHANPSLHVRPDGRLVDLLLAPRRARRCTTACPRSPRT